MKEEVTNKCFYTNRMQGPTTFTRPIKRFRVFVDDNLSDIVDKEIFPLVLPLNFKSKGWASIKRIVNKWIYRALKEMGIFPSETKFNYNRKCGCSCGCSPGYNAVTPYPISSTFDAIWIKFTFNEEEIEELRMEIAKHIAVIHWEIAKGTSV